MRRIVNSNKIVFGKKYLQESEKRIVIPISIQKGYGRIRVKCNDNTYVYLKDLIELKND